MREHILSCLVFVAACSKGDAQPAASSKPVEAAPAPAAEPVAKAPVAKAPVAKPAPKPVPVTDDEPPPVFPRPKADPAKAREIGMKVLTAISRKAEDIPLEINRMFVDVQISPATGKKIEKAFCYDSDTTAWNKLPKQIATRYGARIASADPDTIRCDAHDFLIFCQLSPQDEHEPDVTFAIAPEGGELAGIVERETWMVDPDSARFKADLAHRDRMLRKATKDDCFQPESARGRERPL